MTVTQIAPGINLHVHTTRKFKTSVICVLIRRPLRRVEATLNALVSMIMEMGCAKYDTAAKLAAQTERMYGAVFSCQVVKKGEEQILQFFLEYPPKNNGIGVTAHEAFAFLKEVMLEPLVIDGGFAPDIVENEKRSLSAQISARKNNKSGYALRRLMEEMCPSEAFAIAGDGYAEDIEEITPSSAYAHYRQVLLDSPIEIMVIGDETTDGCEHICREIFGKLERRAEEALRPNLPQPVCKRAMRKNVHEHAQTSQGNIAMGFRGDISPVGAGTYALLLVNEIFGGYGSSRLFSVVRERESLAYAVSSSLYRFKSIIAVQAGVDPANFVRVVGLVIEEIERIADGLTTDAELENARKSLLKKYESVKDYPGQLLDFYTAQHMLGDTDELETVISKIRRIEAGELAPAAARIGIDTIYTLGQEV
ncbi:MAG: insulinase family protein [Defluviitaleaceae bacterium]|nr:insulinase family protein [Defluviitaleaceae bacterium]